MSLIVARRSAVTLCLAGLLTVSGCAAGSGGGGDPTTGGEPPAGATVTRVVTQTAEPADSDSVETDGGGAPTSEDDNGGGGGDSWVMPNEVGKSLQDAQDHIQSVTDDGIFFTDSEDATGQDRSQILDDNWKVCSQNVRPGSRITEDTDITFRAVKLDESCP